MRLVVFALFGALACGTPAAACSPTPGWPENANIQARPLAKEMIAAAAYIDLAKVERVSTDVEFATRSRHEWYGGRRRKTEREVNAAIREARADFPEAVKFHFRVLRRLKGDSRDGFTINGVRYRDAVSKTQPTAVALKELGYFYSQYDFADWPAGAICQRPVYAAVGDSYLIFRDSQGRLLQDDMFSIGVSVVPIARESDPWFVVVRSALAGRK